MCILVLEWQATYWPAERLQNFQDKISTSNLCEDRFDKEVNMTYI
jgi:hypothetical protein